MFDPTSSPRVFGLPCGVDFGEAVVAGLRARLADAPAEAMAECVLILNTRRTQRRITEIFDSGPPSFLPKIALLSNLHVPGQQPRDTPVSALARRLELVELVRNLIAKDDTLAPTSAAFELADSLANLMDEMRDEGRDPSVLRDLDVADQSGHWQRAQTFLAIVTRYFEATAEIDATTQQVRTIEALIAHWQEHPPQTPVIMAGSTGSRGTARRLMQAVARLPQGAVILPGLDTCMPAHAWESLRDTKGLQEDHPQFLHLSFCDTLGIAPWDVPVWHNAPPPSSARNSLVSLALRPAPATYAWRDEGPSLPDLDLATAGLTLVEAQSQREEALAIALRLRAAAESGQSAALITPDRILTRLTTMMLDQWGIVPDESAGIPMQLTAPGRFLRHIAEVMSDRLTAEGLLVLLKHPLCHSGAGRNTHLRHTRDLELRLRRDGPPFPTAEDLRAFGAANDAETWTDWMVAGLGLGLAQEGAFPLTSWYAAHLAMSEHFAAGSEATGSGTLWAQMPGVKAREVMTGIEEAAPAGGSFTAREYLALFSAVLAGEQQTDRDAGDPLIRIWGTLEARVMGVDLVILGGLNEGTWPEAPAPDPWLNRSMRKAAGLLLPERRIGLSAHDFQQAIGGKDVWLTRAIRSNGAATIPARWLNRLTNLLGGLEAGAPALAEMRARGQATLAQAHAFETVKPTEPAKRPSPCPPVAVRPQRLSVTQIGKLIRDPYAIYARHVLWLQPLEPLIKTADAAMRGTVIHQVFEQFIRDGDLSEAALMRIAEAAFAENVPWPEIRVLWQTRLARIAAHVLEEEAARQDDGTPIAFEHKGHLELPSCNFTLTAKADRIDMRTDGTLAIYDYKTGNLPSKPQEKAFDKQLLLMAAMAEHGGFENIAAAAVTKAAYIGVGLNPHTRPAPLDEISPARTRTELESLISAMQSAGFGFTARRAMQASRFAGDYDQLARFGEWNTTDDPKSETLS